jgi:hypothetical protein
LIRRIADAEEIWMLPADWANRATPPRRPTNQAWAFADWVFEQSTGHCYLHPETTASRRNRLSLGKVNHAHIELFMQFNWTRRFLSGISAGEWRVLFADDTPKPKRIFTASSLVVNERPLCCVPDLVMRHALAGTVLIIERKTTAVPEPFIPKEGWPNVEAQLWCYSMIDDWRDTPDVRLVGQLWWRHRGGLQLCHEHPAWRRSDPNHQARCKCWFQRYGGKVID